MPTVQSFHSSTNYVKFKNSLVSPLLLSTTVWQGCLAGRMLALGKISYVMQWFAIVALLEVGRNVNNYWK